MNDEIFAKQVRLINDQGEQEGIIATKDALSKANSLQLDLVELVADSNPPVAKIMDYSKHLYDQKRKKSLARKNQKKVQLKLKEVKFRPNTDIGDYQVKLRNLRGFLEKGHKVKISVWFRGREIAHQSIGAELLERIKQDLEDLAKVEFMPKLEGRQLIMILGPLAKIK